MSTFAGVFSFVGGRLTGPDVSVVSDVDCLSFVFGVRVRRFADFGASTATEWLSFVAEAGVGCWSVSIDEWWVEVVGVGRSSADSVEKIGISVGSVGGVGGGGGGGGRRSGSGSSGGDDAGVSGVRFAGRITTSSSGVRGTFFGVCFLFLSTGVSGVS